MDGSGGFGREGRGKATMVYRGRKRQAEKTILNSRQLQFPDEISTPRHTRARGIDGSSRRQRDIRLQEQIIELQESRAVDYQSPNADDTIQYLDHHVDDADDGDEIESETEVETEDEFQRMDEPVRLSGDVDADLGGGREFVGRDVDADLGGVRRGWGRFSRPRVIDSQLDAREVIGSSRDAGRGAEVGGRDGGS